jgi:hypothetical protein
MGTLELLIVEEMTESTLLLVVAAIQGRVRAASDCYLTAVKRHTLEPLLLPASLLSFCPEKPT